MIEVPRTQDFIGTDLIEEKAGVEASVCQDGSKDGVVQKLVAVVQFPKEAEVACFGASSCFQSKLQGG